jgi:methionyl aminopeptidase
MADKDPTREDWLKAGKIAAQVLDHGRLLIKKGTTILEVCNACDKKIYELGAIPAFPSQISCDDIAAHFCPEENDKTMFEEQLASLDVGVCINGAIGDNAVTVDLSGKYTELIKASRDALNAAIKVAQVGTSLSTIGKEIQDAIQSYGYSPIRNLSGHGLAPYNIHDRPNIPNCETGDKTVLEKGMHIAIEPFATTGKGMIYESSPATLYAMVQKKPVRNPFAREVLAHICTFKDLPFTKRWLTAKFGPLKTNIALNEMLRNGIIRDYPPLIEVNHGPVSQAEHTLIIDDKTIVTTKLD